MSTGPQSPPPHDTQRGQNSRNVILAVVLGLVLFACLLVGGGLLATRWIIHNSHISEVANGDHKQVQIHSPLGNLDVDTGGTDVASLGLEVYPGATLVQRDANSPFRDGVDIGNGHMARSARVHMQIGSANVDVNTGEFVSNASPDQLMAFYSTRLGTYGTVTKRNSYGATTTLEVRNGNNDVHAVSIRPGVDGTHFELVRVNLDNAPN